MEIITFKYKINLNYTLKLNFYLTQNTARLCLKYDNEQLLLFKKISAVYCENRNKETTTLWEKHSFKFRWS